MFADAIFPYWVRCSFHPCARRIPGLSYTTHSSNSHNSPGKLFLRFLGKDRLLSKFSNLLVSGRRGTQGSNFFLQVLIEVVLLDTVVNVLAVERQTHSVEGSAVCLLIPSPLEQCFSNQSPGHLVRRQILIQDLGSRAWSSAFLKSSSVILWVWVPRVEEQGCSPCCELSLESEAE